jgi:hypothetical protein
MDMNWVHRPDTVIKGAYPSVEADVLWLHTLKSVEDKNRIGGIRLEDNNVFAHVSGKIPIWRIGPVVPSFLVAGDLNSSVEGFHHADLQLGLSTLVEFSKWMIEVGGAVSPMTTTPYFRLKVIYK